MKKDLLITLLFQLVYFIAFGQLTIIVDEIPENTPENDQIYIAGDFQGWDPGSSEHILAFDIDLNYHHITLESGIGDIEFKFTRGSWASVESNENGNYIPNRFYSPNEGDTIHLQILGWEDLNGNGSGTSTATENVTILTDSFYMPEFDRYRRIWIYLPPDYDSAGFDYPVLYMHDGQNVFDLLTSFAGEWEVDETLNELHAEGDPGVIVVAIDNGQNHRIDEYSAWVNPTYGGGDGDIYINFIINDLKPYIDANYNTLPDRENTGLMGSSLGGLISTYGGIEYQEVFSKIGAFSPSYWFNPESFTHVSETGMQESMRIYQVVGSLEGMTDDMFAMEDTLLAAGFEEDNVLSIEVEGGQHSEWFWAQEFEAAYLWLFGGWNTTDIKVVANDIKFNIYPNPTSDFITIESERSINSITIFSLSGQLIESIKTSSTIYQLDVSPYIPGLYLLQVETDNGTFANKISVK